MNSIRQFLRDKAFQNAIDPKHDGYQKGLASMVYKCFDKKSSDGAIKTVPNYQLANESHRQIIENLREEKFTHLLKTIFGVLIQLICSH